MLPVTLFAMNWAGVAHADHGLHATLLAKEVAEGRALIIKLKILDKLYAVAKWYRRLHRGKDDKAIFKELVDIALEDFSRLMVKIASGFPKLSYLRG